MLNHLRHFVVIALCLACMPVGADEVITLHNDLWNIEVHPASMQVIAYPNGRAKFELSAAQADLGRAANIKSKGAQVAFDLPEKHISASLELKGSDLLIHLQASKDGSFTWPVVRQSPALKGLIWPRWEGCYIPINDAKWGDYLVREEWNTLEGLSMPFWGLDCGDFGLTYIITNAYNNRIIFVREGDQLTESFTHEFTPNNAHKEYGFVIRFSEGNSPIQPAKEFRKWLMENGRFVSMKDKMKKVPKVARLLGAAHVYLWGDGISRKMLDQFQQAGLDRMELCVEGWSAVDKQPDVVAQADKMGYLFGTYDSYHSVHDPALKGTDATWETAQFDKDLYDNGPIVGRDGKKLAGYKKRGFKLSPIAARPYVEKRVRDVMARTPFNYYFVDCDAYGEVYDDYSPLHPATQAEDAAARDARLAWIADTFHVVVGSEGGSSYAAPVIHVAEGIFAPAFGWGDADLTTRTSKYYLGGYWPPEGPRVFTQQVTLKPEYEYLYYDPRFRLPLYETVFHDSVVATSHWSRASLKFANVLDTVALTELLYQVPPMYHMNLSEFKKYQETIKKHYAFFSPLHRELGFAQMTDFTSLTPDRMVQRTVFGGRVELVANFQQQAFKYQEWKIPPRSILARWLESGKTKVFTP